jgi:hypothetical protein
MKCCTACFKDPHIRDTIQKLGEIGDCGFCASSNIAVYDTSINSNLIADMLASLIEMYAVSYSPSARPISEALLADWDIFNTDSGTVLALIKNVCKPAYKFDLGIFTEPVLIPQLTDSDFMREFCVVGIDSWRKFSDSIKNLNRFHTTIFNSDAFASLLSITAKTYERESRFFRARISLDQTGFPHEKMGAPPPGIRLSGRVNPEGISVLYLSSDRETVLHEVRASTFDYVTIGEFQPRQNVKVVNLSGIATISPFVYPDGLERYIANRNVFKEIASELAKPLRRNDSSTEYLPTQFIAEFIKSEKYDGVEYASSLNEGGYNLAFFQPDMFECLNVQTIEVSKITYNTLPSL